MPCYSPIQAWQSDVNENGKRPLLFKRPDVVATELKCPCGGCIGCRLENARQWAMRCRDESSLHAQNCFITLTYSEEFRPKDCFLSKSVWQSFMKRFRKVVGPDVRFMMCGEYSPEHFYPHYHALLFNYDFPDRVFFKTTPAGEKIYLSQMLSDIWGFGYVSVGDLTSASASYVCRYTLKKADVSAVAGDHFVVPTTGELRTPEFRLMSRMPGIGRGFYEKFKSDIFPNDYRLVDGVKSTPPRYYGNLFSLTDPVAFSKIKSMRVKRARKFVDGKDDNDMIRLGIKELVKSAQLSALRRKGVFE